MTGLRMDNVLIVVDDLEAVKAFFAELGLELEGEAVVEGQSVLARLQARGAELVGEVGQYEDGYRLCYARGPEGIVVALAAQLA